MSKDTEALSKEGKQAVKVVEDVSLPQLSLRMNEVIGSRQPKDKVFIKNELKLKPIIDVPKHSFKDNCSSTAIIDFTLMQAAFRHFSKISDFDLVKNDLQHVPKTDDSWKDQYLLESKLDVIPNGTSEESDLEKTLIELKMTEISNDISDPEVREFCNKLSATSFSDTLCSVPYDSSVELSPKKPPVEMNGHLSIKKGVKRKKINAYTRRKKSKKQKLLSKSNDLKPLLRNVKKLSSDSSEDGIVPFQQSELSKVENNLCTSEVSEQSSGNNMEQNLDSVSLTSPTKNTSARIVDKEKALKCNTRKKSKPKKSITKKDSSKLIQICKPLPKNIELPSTNGSKDPLGTSGAQQNELSEVEKRSYTSEEAKHNSLNKLRQQFDVASSKAVIKTINDIVESDPTRGISSCESIIQTINDVVENNRAESTSLQVEQHINGSSCIGSCDISTADCKAVVNHSDHEMDFSCAGNSDDVPRDANSNDSFITLDECNDTSNFQTMHSTEEIKHSFNKDSPINQDSQTESQMDSLQSQSKTPKEAAVKKPAIARSLSQQNFDQDTVLDYEYDLDLSEPESLEEHYIRVNSERHLDVEDHSSFSADKDLHLTEDSNSPSIALNRYDGDEKVIEDSSDKSPVNENCVDSDVSPIPTRSSKATSEANSGEMSLTSREEKIVTMPDVSKDVDMRKEFMLSFSNDAPAFQKIFAAAYSDDDSNSDSEQSFKRRLNNNSPQCQNLKKISEQPPSTSPSNLQQMAPGQCIRTLSDCLNHINYQSKNNLIEAVSVAGKYLSISDKPACNEIFEGLFLGIKKNICLTNIIPEEAVKEAFNLLKKYNTDSSWLYSLIICEYFQEPLLVRFALDLCTICQKGNIPIKDNAVQAYINNAVSKSAPEHILLKFLDYVKHVCKLNFPKPLLCQLLERVPKGEDWCLLPEFEQICNLLCALNEDEFEKKPLQEFIVNCIKNNCWDQVARFFQSWAGTGDLSDLLLSALQFRLEDVGMFFKKLAAALHRSGEQDHQCTLIFGYIGITIMLTSYYKGKSEDESSRNAYMVNAFEVLYTLQKYNVNFYYLHESFYTSEIANKFSTDPFNMVFIATEICISLERPKDAYHIIKGFLPYATTQHLPKIDPQHILHILSVRLEHLKYFLQLIQMLHHTDPLGIGLKSFLDLLEILNQEDLDHLVKECTNVNLEVIKTLFNEYLVLNLNKKLKDNVLKLYQHLEGPCKTLLTLDSEVLRGLVVFLTKNQRMNEAISLFEVGCIRNIYQFKKKTSKEDFPWNVTMLSHWTSQEMRLVLGRFLKSLFPVLMCKTTNVNFNSWYTVKISFKEYHCTPSKINCLMEQFAVSETALKGNCTIENAMKRTCNILNSIDPDFTWEENKDHVLLDPSPFYNYWKKNYAESKEKEKQPFQVSATKVLNFGESKDTVEAANDASLELQVDHSPRSKTSPYFDSGPIKHHLPGEEVSSTTSDLFTRKRTSRSSSERSSSSHASERDLLTRAPQPFLFRSPISNFVGKNMASPRNYNDLQVSPSLSQSPQHNLSPLSPRKTPQKMAIPFQSPKQGQNNSPGRFTSINGANPTTIMCADQNKNRTGGFTVSPLPLQKINSGNSNPVKGANKKTFGKKVCPPRKLNDRTTLNTVPSLIGSMGAASSLVNHSPELSVFAEPLARKLKRRNQPKKKVKKVRRKKLQSIPNGVGHVVGNNLNAAVEKIPPIPRNDSSDVYKSNAAASMDEHLCSNSSLENHCPELSVFGEPPRPQLKAKRRLNMNRDCEVSKPPYRIQTPCKQVKVIRPITPCLKSFNVRCKTPISFSSAPRLNLCVKRPIPNTVASTSSNIKHTDFTNFVVTVQGNSVNNKIVTSPDNPKGSKLFPTETVKKFNGPVFQNLKGNSLAKQCTGKKFKITRNFNQTVVEDFAGKVPPSDISVTVKDTSKQSLFKVPQARRYNNVPENDFQKILTFLKSKVMLKCKTSSPGEQHDKANSLANTFIKNNGVQHLDAKTKKLLVHFAETCIY